MSDEYYVKKVGVIKPCELCKPLDLECERCVKENKDLKDENKKLRNVLKELEAVLDKHGQI